MDITKNRLNRKSNTLQRQIKKYYNTLLKSQTTSVTRIYTSRPSCIICEVDMEYLSTRSRYLPMILF